MGDELTRTEVEIDHANRILDRAEQIWSWSTPAGQVRIRRRAELLRQEVHLDAGSCVLELGTGTGVFTEAFSKTGARIVGFDISVKFLQQARRLRDLRTVCCTAGDAERLPFADSSFDAVVGSSVLHHLPIQEALQECHRVLRPGGRLVFAEPNMLNPQVFLVKNIPWIKRRAGEVPHETAFVRWLLSRTLRECGFRVERISPHDFLHPSVPRAWIPWVTWIGGWCEKAPVVRELAGSLLIVAQRRDDSDPWPN